jgi:hypothetical protein
MSLNIAQYEKYRESSNTSWVTKNIDGIELALTELDYNDNPVVVETWSYIKSSWESLNKHHDNTGGPKATNFEFRKAENALPDYQKYAISYLNNQNNQDRDKLYQLSNYIVDKLAITALEWGGKTGLKNFYEEQVKALKSLSATLKILNDSATVLNQFVNDQSTDTLHVDYYKDFKKYSRLAMLWLILSTIIGICFLVMVGQSINTTPEFIKEFTGGDIDKNFAIPLLYALIPKVAFGTITLIITLAFWKNYQSYKHLEITTKAKLNVAKMMPILKLNAGSQQEYVNLQLEFIRKMSIQEETGFYHQAKTTTSVGVGSAKVS